MFSRLKTFLRNGWSRLTGQTQKHAVRQVSSFITIGLAQLLVEWFAFVVLTYAGLDIVVANLVSRGAAAIFGFYMNGRITFRAHVDRNALLRFAAVWLLLSGCDTGFVYLIGHTLGLPMAQLTKPVVDGAIAVMSFVLAKKWVYRPLIRR